jgi:hypothetical protein
MESWKNASLPHKNAAVNGAGQRISIKWLRRKSAAPNDRLECALNPAALRRLGAVVSATGAAAGVWS